MKVDEAKEIFSQNCENMYSHNSEKYLRIVKIHILWLPQCRKGVTLIMYKKLEPVTFGINAPSAQYTAPIPAS